MLLVMRFQNKVLGMLICWQVLVFVRRKFFSGRPEANAKAFLKSLSEGKVFYKAFVKRVIHQI